MLYSTSVKGSFLVALMASSVYGFGNPNTSEYAATVLAPKQKAQSVSAVELDESTTTAIDKPVFSPSSSLIDESLFLNEEDSLASMSFPISLEELITKSKEFLSANQGVERPELLDDSFCFMGPVVGGPEGLPKENYLKAVGGFQIKDAFPDINPRFHDFRADKLDAGRIWFTSVATGTDNGTGFLGNKPTGKSFRTPPQACSLKFNEDGKVIKYTIGHVMERSMGNTGGMGGIFGPAYAIGKPLPFPEARPYKPSKRYRFIQFIGALASKMNKKKGQSGRS